MFEQPPQSVVWDGDVIIGGEPIWFKSHVSSGVIERSAEGAGFCLIVHGKSKTLIVKPGECLSLVAAEAFEVSAPVSRFDATV